MPADLRPPGRPQGTTTKQHMTLRKQFFWLWGFGAGRQLMTQSPWGQRNGAETHRSASGSQAEGTPGNVLLIIMGF